MSAWPGCLLPIMCVGSLSSGPTAAHLLHLLDLRRKSFRSKPSPLLTLSASFCAAAMSTPLGDLLDQGHDVAHAQHAAGVAVGVEDFKPSIFSDTPANLIGAPVIWRTDSAAPPRESPSSLVRTTPVSGSASFERLGGVDRVLALHGIDDEQGFDRVQVACRS